MSKKLTKEEFIEKANLKHSDYYDYSLVNYVKSKINVKIICPIHGVFEQTPNSHLLGHGCPKCSIIRRSNFRRTGIDMFVDQANKKHKNFYNYSLVKYYNNNTNVIIVCPIHGEFLQTPNSHLNYQGCPKCGRNNMIIKMRLTNDEYIERANKKHNNYYDYSETNYINATTKINIISPIHGNFVQRPYDHLNGCGCQKCVESNGERRIRNFLEINKINYIKEKTFKDCKDKIVLPFDFYLPELNILVEFDGIQHYEAIEYFGGEKSLVSQQNRDLIKTEFAKSNEYNLIRIAYNENIEEKLNVLLNSIILI